MKSFDYNNPQTLAESVYCLALHDNSPQRFIFELYHLAENDGERLEIIEKALTVHREILKKNYESKLKDLENEWNDRKRQFNLL